MFGVDQVVVNEVADVWVKKLEKEGSGWGGRFWVSGVEGCGAEVDVLLVAFGWLWYGESRDGIGRLKIGFGEKLVLSSFQSNHFHGKAGSVPGCDDFSVVCGGCSRGLVVLSFPESHGSVANFGPSRRFGGSEDYS